MGYTPDDLQGGISDAAKLILRNDGETADAPGEVVFNGTDIQMRDSTGVFNPRSGGGGITEGQHEVLDTLVHRIAETNYTEVTRSSGQVVSVIVWETVAKLKKIRETTITRSGGQVSTFVEKHYDAAGVVIAGQTLTSTVTRSSGQVVSIDTVQS